MPEDSLSIRYVRVLLDVVEHRGVTRAAFLKAARWEAQRVAVEEGRVTPAELGRLVELAIELTRDPALGLHTLRAIRGESVNLVAQLSAHAPTVRDALEGLVSHHKLMNDVCPYQVIETRREVTVRYHRPAGFSARVTRFLTELNLHGLHRLLRYFAPHARPTRVDFEHRAPAYRAEYERIFAGTERFEQAFSGIVFDRALLDASRMYHDAELHRTVLALADSRILRLKRDAACVDRVRDVLTRHQAPSAATMSSVADELGISPRTLRRRLAAENTSYEAVANATLAQRARALLSIEQRTIGETALALGYSDTSAFHRAFKRWTGTTPSASRTSAERSEPASKPARRVRRTGR